LIIRKGNTGKGQVSSIHENGAAESATSAATGIPADAAVAAAGARLRDRQIADGKVCVGGSW
jgi:hypothetical protein